DDGIGDATRDEETDERRDEEDDEGQAEGPAEHAALEIGGLAHREREHERALGLCAGAERHRPGDEATAVGGAETVHGRERRRPGWTRPPCPPGPPRRPRWP